MFLFNSKSRKIFENIWRDYGPYHELFYLIKAVDRDSHQWDENY